MSEILIIRNSHHNSKRIFYPRANRKLTRIIMAYGFGKYYKRLKDSEKSLLF